MTLRGGVAIEQTLDLFRCQSERFRRSLVEPARRIQRVAQLAVDLDRERHLVVDQQRGIERRPGRVDDHALLAKRRPGLFGKMRRRRRCQLHQRADRVRPRRRRLRLLDRGGQLVQLGNRLVELEAVERFA